MNYEEWNERSACGPDDLDLFYADPTDAERQAQAKAICARCSVQKDCLRYALEHGEDEGIWAGHTPNELRRMPGWTQQRRRPDRPLAPCGTAGGYRRHLRRGEPACEQCLAAKRLETADNKARRTQVAS